MSAASTESPASNAPPFLAGVLGHLFVPGRVRGDAGLGNAYRRYSVEVCTNTTIQTVNTSALYHLIYEVDPVATGLSDSMTKFSGGLEFTATSDIPSGLVDALADDCFGGRKRFFHTASFVAVTEKVAQMMAACSHFPESSLGDFVAKEKMTISEFDVGQVCSAATRVLFIPCDVDARCAVPGTLSVLAVAASMSGSLPFTNSGVQSSTIELHTLGGRDLVNAIYSAWSYLAKVMTYYGDYDLFVWATVRGIHKGSTVVAHTDEGGFVRELLRAQRFAPSYGPLWADSSTSSVMLPELGYPGNNCLAAVVDSIALATAAAVSHCDPGAEVDGSWFPTVSAVPPELWEQLDGPAKEPGLAADHSTDKCSDGVKAEDTKGEGRWGTARGQEQYFRLQMPLNKFWDQYLQAILVIFGGDKGSLRRTTIALVKDMSYFHKPGRHFDYKVLAPFFWIEPSSILLYQQFGFPAEDHGMASLGNHRKPVAHPWFDKVLAAQTVVTGCDFLVQYRNARTAHLLTHLRYLSDGLADVWLTHADSSRFILTGLADAKGEHADPVAQAMADRRSFDQYLWKRRQSPLSAPADAMYTATRLKFWGRQCEIRFEGGTLIPLASIPTNFPTTAEMLDSESYVRYYFSQPKAVPAGKHKSTRAP